MKELLWLMSHLFALVMQIIRPLFPTRSAFSINRVRASCWYSVILHRVSTAATRPCRMLQHSGSARGLGGPTAANAAISWRKRENDYVTRSMYKSDKDITRKLQPVYLTNMDTNNLNEIPPNQIQQHIKRFIHHDKLYTMTYSPGMQSWFNIWKSINVNTNKIFQKPHDHLHKHRKSISRNPGPFIIKTINKLDIDRNFLKQKMAPTKNLQMTSSLIVKIGHIPSMIRSRRRLSSLITSIPHYIGGPSPGN